jgi:regulator of sigma E protease
MEPFSQPGILFSAMMFLLVLGPLVFIHELGHYSVARWCGVRVDVFSIGFGRELVGWHDKHGTRWKICLLPLGGYVKFFGDMNAASQPDTQLDTQAKHYSDAERSVAFPFKPLWQRALVVLAGPVANFLFAIGIFTILFVSFGVQETAPIVGQVVPNSAAAQAGFQAGDIVVSADGQRIKRFERLVRLTAINPGRPMEIVVKRAGVERSIRVTPRLVEEVDRFGNKSKRGLLGLSFAGVQSRVYEVNIFQALFHAVGECIELVRLMADTLWQIVSGVRSVSDMGGPLKIAQMSGQTATLGVFGVVSFMALISLNLGFVNLLPIPMLDGGHLLLYAAEGVRGQPVSQKVQEYAFLAGFAFVISLTLLLTWNDLSSFGVWTAIARLLG